MTAKCYKEKTENVEKGKKNKQSSPGQVSVWLFTRSSDEKGSISRSTNNK